MLLLPILLHLYVSRLDASKIATLFLTVLPI